MCKVKCENNGQELYVEPGTTLLSLLKGVNIDGDLPFISAYVNNKSKDLNYKVYENRSVLFVDTSHFEGYRVYERTLNFLLARAVKMLYGDVRLQIKYSISHGSYFELEGMAVSEEVAQALMSVMEELVAQNLPITRDVIETTEAIELYENDGLCDKVRFLKSNPRLYTTINTLDGMTDHFHGTLAPSTGYVPLFEITPFYDGYCLVYPQRSSPAEMSPFSGSKKIFDVMCNHKSLLEILDVSNVGALNTLISHGKSDELIRVGEVVQENNFSLLAQRVHESCQGGVKVVLISGPSSSGKTTFSNRLTMQLLVFGYKPLVISMDNYFVNRVDSPIDEEGNYDFDTLESLDVELFNDNIYRLVDGETVELPTYNFKSGEREWKGNTMSLGEKNILIIEGIHLLNPRLAENIAADKKFKIYVSALTSVSLDDHTRLSTTDNRLVRRIVRDAAYRGHTAEMTLARWASVRRGEDSYIFPFQDNADFLFNTALFFEYSVLKSYALPLLYAVPNTVKEYSEAQRLISILKEFTTISADMIPPTSIIREFIGGSSFKY